MTVIEELATSLNRRDETPNIELAQRIADADNAEAVKELIDNLEAKNKGIQSDCIKTLYEVGERKPALIADHTETFLTLLNSRNNRLVWGAMTALHSVTTLRPQTLYENMTAILDAMQRGSVITKDQGVHIMIALARIPTYSSDALALLLEQLKGCAENQLAMYAERALPVISSAYAQDFADALATRLEEIEKESKRKRIQKTLKKLHALG